MTQANESPSLHRQIESIWEDMIDLKQIAYFLSEHLEADLDRYHASATLQSAHSKTEVDARAWSASKLWFMAEDIDNRLVAVMNRVIDEAPPEWVRSRLEEAVREKADA